MKLTAFSPRALHTTLWTNDFILWVLVTWCYPWPQSLLKIWDTEEIPRARPLKYENLRHKNLYTHIHIFISK